MAIAIHATLWWPARSRRQRMIAIMTMRFQPGPDRKTMEKNPQWTKHLEIILEQTALRETSAMPRSLMMSKATRMTRT